MAEKMAFFLLTTDRYVGEQYHKAGEVVEMPASTKGVGLTKLKAVTEAPQADQGDGRPFDVAVPDPVLRRAPKMAGHALNTVVPLATTVAVQGAPIAPTAAPAPVKLADPA